MQQIIYLMKLQTLSYSNNKIVPVKDAGDHIKDPVVKEIFDAAQEASSIQLVV